MARTATGRRSFIEQARREQIVAAAIDVLCESGFAAASIGAIADRIGVSKGVISYHFTSKDELLREVVGHVLAEAGTYMRPRIEAAGSALQALRAYVRSNLDYISAHRRKILAFTEIVNGLPPGRAEPGAYEEGNRQAVARLRRLLADGQAAGEFGAFSAQVAAVSLRASIDELSVLLRADPDFDVAGYGAELLRLYERAVLA
ncbi:MAG TPA: TetR family transcriptional regulator [Streptosporangiaceae bacterium]|jgi:AcrR family transcriptional regulator